MHTFHRLAFARLAQDRAEAELAIAAASSSEVQELTTGPSSQPALLSASLPSSQTADTNSLGADVALSTDRTSSATMSSAAADDAEQLTAVDEPTSSLDETAFMPSSRGTSRPSTSFSPVKETDRASSVQSQVEA